MTGDKLGFLKGRSSLRCSGTIWEVRSGSI